MDTSDRSRILCLLTDLHEKARFTNFPIWEIRLRLNNIIFELEEIQAKMNRIL